MGSARDRRRDAAKGGGRTDDEPETERKSLRKAADDEGAPAFWHRKRIVSWAVVVLVLGTALFVWKVDGGAPQDDTRGVLHVDALQVESWTLRVTKPDARILCTMKQDCEASELWAAAEANETCRLDVRVWLASALNPTVLRDVDLSVAGSIRHGRPESGDKVSQENISGLKVTEDQHWDVGWWWRVEAERLTFRHEVPCDMHRADLQVSIRAKELFGAAWSEGQPFGPIVFHEQIAVIMPTLGGDDGDGTTAPVDVRGGPNGVAGS